MVDATEELPHKENCLRTWRVCARAHRCACTLCLSPFHLTIQN